jgi:hypothetical protein
MEAEPRDGGGFGLGRLTLLFEAGAEAAGAAEAPFDGGGVGLGNAALEGCDFFTGGLDGIGSTRPELLLEGVPKPPRMVAGASGAWPGAAVDSEACGFFPSPSKTSRSLPPLSSGIA